MLPTISSFILLLVIRTTIGYNLNALVINRLNTNTLKNSRTTGSEKTTRISTSLNQFKTNDDNTLPNSSINRRQILHKSAKALTSGIATTSLLNTPVQAHERFKTYQINPDPISLSPTLSSIKTQNFLETISFLNSQQGGAIWLGEHHNSLRDHVLQASIISDVYYKRKNINSDIAIGLEMIQLQYQHVLDAYVSKQISEDTMLKEVQWEKRWSWPFDVYRPIFECARDKGIKLLALNVNSEDLQLVEQGGYPALPRSILKSYISDPIGFATLASTTAFKEYVNYVITPSYRMHKDMKILKDPDMPFDRFLSGRLLWDETMAGTAASWCNTNPNGVLLGCVGLDHVKFVNGIPVRFQRMTGGNNLSLLLNPTLIDTRPPGTTLLSENGVGADRITLQLQYEENGVLPLADYLVLS